MTTYIKSDKVSLGGSNVKNLRVELEDQLHTNLKLYAVTSKRNIKDIVVKAIEEYLQRANAEKYDFIGLLKEIREDVEDVHLVPIDEKTYGERWGYILEDGRVVPKSQLKNWSEEDVKENSD